jgi:hypothetical protein
MRRCDGTRTVAADNPSVQRDGMSLGAPRDTARPVQPSFATCLLRREMYREPVFRW